MRLGSLGPELPPPPEPTHLRPGHAAHKAGGPSHRTRMFVLRPRGYLGIRPGGHQPREELPCRGRIRSATRWGREPGARASALGPLLARGQAVVARRAQRLQVGVGVVPEGPAAIAVVDMGARAPAALGLAYRVPLPVALGDLVPAVVVAPLLGRSPAGVVAAPRLAQMRGAEPASLDQLGAGGVGANAELLRPHARASGAPRTGRRRESPARRHAPVPLARASGRGTRAARGGEPPRRGQPPDGPEYLGGAALAAEDLIELARLA
jgi:hypothetical protein